jgi:hypothetical protein
MVALWTKTHLFNDLSSVTYMACDPDGSLVATAYQFKITLKGEAIFVSSVNICVSLPYCSFFSLRPPHGVFLLIFFLLFYLRIFV